MSGLLPTNMIKDSQKLLDVISQRQEALSDNIANMHTIGYKRKDIDFSQYLNNGSISSLEAKTIEKYGPSPISSMQGGEQLTTEEEFGLMQQNYMLYSVAVKKLKSAVTEIKTALNVSSNG